MATVPTGQLSISQIIGLATRKAANPQLAVQSLSTVPSDAHMYLVMYLYQLYTTFDWPFLYTSATLNLVGSQFTLPTDFLQAQDDTSFLVTTVNGQPTQQFVQEYARDTFAIFATDLQTTGGSPLAWTADRNAGVGLLFPNLGVNTATATLRYKMLPSADTVFPTTAAEIAAQLAVIPTFPWASFLVHANFTDCLIYEKDSRAESAVMLRESMLASIRSGAETLRSQSPVIPLDSEVFSQPFQGD